MTTPYGTTAFRHEPSPTSSASYRMIEATDPLGGTERLEFHWSNGSISATAPSGQVPTGFSGRNDGLDKYNTLYWDKRATHGGYDGYDRSDGTGDASAPPSRDCLTSMAEE